MPNSLSPERLVRFARDVLHAAGASTEEAATVAQSLIDANLRGYDSHGLMRLPFYVEMLEAGEIRSGAPLDILQDSPTHLAGDANWGFGRVQAGQLLEQLLQRARNQAVAVGTLRQSSHIGRLGEYCELAAGQGCLSILMVNTHGAAKRVAPPGGRAPRLGTNPIAIGVPAEPHPLVLDFSTSATAEGKVRVKKIAGESCPEGWLIDSTGLPTTNPNDLYADPPGSILPMGGSQTYKGFGLALMIDIFAGALSGGLCSREVPESPKGNCVFMMVVSPAAFGGTEHFQRELRQLIEFVRSCPTAPGVDQIRLPGDPELESLAKHKSSGLSFDEDNWKPMMELAKRYQINLSDLQ